MKLVRKITILHLHLYFISDLQMPLDQTLAINGCIVISLGTPKPNFLYIASDNKLMLTTRSHNFMEKLNGLMVHGMLKAPRSSFL